MGKKIILSGDKKPVNKVSSDIYGVGQSNPKPVLQDTSLPRVEPIGERNIAYGDFNEYLEYVPTIYNVGKKSLDYQRAIEQGSGEQFGLTMDNLIVNTGLGLVENAGLLIALVTEWGDERDYSNLLTDFGKRCRNPFGKIYREHPDKLFDFNDAASWFEVGGSLLESVGEFAITGFGVGSAFKVAGKGLFSILARGVTNPKLLSIIGITTELAPQLGTAYTLGYIEGAMSGAEVYKQVINETGNPHLAAQSAAATTRLNTLIVGTLNITGIGSMFKTNVTRLRSFNKQLQLALKDAKTLADKVKVLETFNPKFTKESLGGILGLEATQEGIEEVINNIAEWYGLNKADIDNRTLFDVIYSPESLFAFITGAIGGVGQTAAIRSLPMHKVVDEEGNIKRTTINKKENYERMRKFKEYVENTKSDFNELIDLHDKLAKEEDEDVKNIIKDKIYNLFNKRSVWNGQHDVIKEYYKSIANLSQEKAIKQGFATNFEDKSYINLAEKAIKNLDKYKEKHDYFLNKYRFTGIEELSGYGEMLYHKFMKIEENKSVLEELDVLKNSIKNDISELSSKLGNVTIDDVIELQSKINALKKRIDEVNNIIKEYERYQKIIEKDKKLKEQIKEDMSEYPTMADFNKRRRPVKYVKPKVGKVEDIERTAFKNYGKRELKSKRGLKIALGKYSKQLDEHIKQLNELFARFESSLEGEEAIKNKTKKVEMWNEALNEHKYLIEKLEFIEKEKLDIEEINKEDVEDFNRLQSPKGKESFISNWRNELKKTKDKYLKSKYKDLQIELQEGKKTIEELSKKYPEFKKELEIEKKRRDKFNEVLKKLNKNKEQSKEKGKSDKEEKGEGKSNKEEKKEENKGKKYEKKEEGKKEETKEEKTEFELELDDIKKIDELITKDKKLESLIDNNNDLSKLILEKIKHRNAIKALEKLKEYYEKKGEKIGDEAMIAIFISISKLVADNKVDKELRAILDELNKYRVKSDSDTEGLVIYESNITLNTTLKNLENNLNNITKHIENKVKKIVREYKESLPEKEKISDNLDDLKEKRKELVERTNKLNKLLDTLEQLRIEIIKHKSDIEDVKMSDLYNVLLESKKEGELNTRLLNILNKLTELSIKNETDTEGIFDTKDSKSFKEAYQKYKDESIKNKSDLEDINKKIEELEGQEGEKEEQGQQEEGGQEQEGQEEQGQRDDIIETEVGKLAVKNFEKDFDENFSEEDVNSLRLINRDLYLNRAIEKVIQAIYAVSKYNENIYINDITIGKLIEQLYILKSNIEDVSLDKHIDNLNKILNDKSIKDLFNENAKLIDILIKVSEQQYKDNTDDITDKYESVISFFSSGDNIRKEVTNYSRNLILALNENINKLAIINKVIDYIEEIKRVLPDLIKSDEKNISLDVIYLAILDFYKNGELKNISTLLNNNIKELENIISILPIEHRTNISSIESYIKDLLTSINDNIKNIETELHTIGIKLKGNDINYDDVFYNKNIEEVIKNTYYITLYNSMLKQADELNIKINNSLSIENLLIYLKLEHLDLPEDIKELTFDEFRQLLYNEIENIKSSSVSTSFEINALNDLLGIISANTIYLENIKFKKINSLINYSIKFFENNNEIKTVKDAIKYISEIYNNDDIDVDKKRILNFINFIKEIGVSESTNIKDIEKLYKDYKKSISNFHDKLISLDKKIESFNPNAEVLINIYYHKKEQSFVEPINLSENSEKQIELGIEEAISGIFYRDYKIVEGAETVAHLTKDYIEFSYTQKDNKGNKILVVKKVSKTNKINKSENTVIFTDKINKGTELILEIDKNYKEDILDEKGNVTKTITYDDLKDNFEKVPIVIKAKVADEYVKIGYVHTTDWIEAVDEFGTPKNIAKEYILSEIDEKTGEEKIKVVPNIEVQREKIRKIRQLVFNKKSVKAVVSEKYAPYLSKNVEIKDGQPVIKNNKIVYKEDKASILLPDKSLQLSIIKNGNPHISNKGIETNINNLEQVEDFDGLVGVLIPSINKDFKSFIPLRYQKLSNNIDILKSIVNTIEAFFSEDENSLDKINEELNKLGEDIIDKNNINTLAKYISKFIVVGEKTVKYNINRHDKPRRPFFSIVENKIEFAINQDDKIHIISDINSFKRKKVQLTNHLKEHFIKVDIEKINSDKKESVVLINDDKNITSKTYDTYNEFAKDYLTTTLNGKNKIDETGEYIYWEQPVIQFELKGKTEVIIKENGEEKNINLTEIDDSSLEDDINILNKLSDPDSFLHNSDYPVVSFDKDSENNADNKLKLEDSIGDLTPSQIHELTLGVIKYIYSNIVVGNNNLEVVLTLYYNSIKDALSVYEKYSNINFDTLSDKVKNVLASIGITNKSDLDKRIKNLKDIIDNFTTLKKIVERRLSAYGIKTSKIKLTEEEFEFSKEILSNESSIETTDNIINTDDDITDFELTNYGSKIELSPDVKNKTPFIVKLMLSSINDSKYTNGKKVASLNFLGFNKTLDFDKVYDELSRVLAGTDNTIESIIKRLSEKANEKPYFKEIIDRLTINNNDTDEVVTHKRELQTHFVNAFCKYRLNKKSLFFRFVYKYGLPIGYQYNTIESDSNNISNEIMNLWLEDLKQSKLSKYNEKSELVIDKKEVLDLKQKYEKLLKDNDINSDKFLVGLQNVLAEMGISLPLRALDKLRSESYEYLGTSWKRAVSLYNAKGKAIKGFMYYMFDSFLSTEVEDEIELPFYANNPLGKTINKEFKIKRLADLASEFIDNVFSNTFINSEGKLIYSYQLNTHNNMIANKLLTDKQFVNSLLNISFTQDSFILQLAREGSLHKVFSISLFDAYKNTNKKIGNKFKNLPERDRLIIRLNLFFNKGLDIAHYMFPTEANRDVNTLITFSKFKTDVIIDSEGNITDVSNSTKDLLFNLALSEIKRIKSFQENKSKFEKQNAKYGSYLANAGKFNIFPFLNYNELSEDIRDEIWNSEDELDISEKGIEIIKNLLTEFAIDEINKFVTRLEDNNILTITKNKSGKKYKLNNVDYRIANKGRGSHAELRHISDFILNTIIMNMEAYRLFIGDPAFTSKGDYETTLANTQKRARKNSTTWYSGNFRKRTVVRATINDDISESVMAKEYGKVLENNKYKEVTKTDGFEYTTVQEHIDFLYAYNLIPTRIYDSISKKIKESKDGYYILTKEELRNIFVAVKPVHVANIIDIELDIFGKNYVKSSSIPLIPQFTKNLEIDKLRKAMEEQGVDRVAYESATKLGNKNVDVVWKNGKLIDNIEFKSKEVVTRDGFGLQNHVPNDSKDSIKRVSQALFTLFSAHRTKGLSNELELEKERIVSDIITYKFNNLLKDFKIKYNPDIDSFEFNDIKKLKNVILEEAKARNWNEESIKLLDETDEESFKQSIFVNDNYKQIEYLLLSIIKNRISKFKLNGFASIQIPDSGLTQSKKAKLINEKDINSYDNTIIYIEGFNPEDKLKSIRKEVVDGKEVVKPAQILIPFNFKYKGKELDIRKFTKIKDGRLVIDKNKIPDELRQLIGFRIPNQSISNIVPMEVVGFINANNSTIVVVPDTITVQMGSDFDLDKLYSYFRPYVYDSKNKKLKTLSKKEISKEEIIKEIKENLKNTFKGKESDLNKLAEELYNDYLESGEIEEESNTINYRQLTNKFFDINWKTLTDKDVFDSLIQPLDKDYLETESKNYQLEKPKSILSPAYQYDTYTQQTEGEDLIALFVNMNKFNFLLGKINRSKLIDEPIKVKTKSGEILDLQYIGGNRFTIEENEQIPSYVISDMYISASVDNSSNPVLGKVGININNYHIPVLLYLLSNNEGKLASYKYGIRLVNQEGFKNPNKIYRKIDTLFDELEEAYELASKIILSEEDLLELYNTKEEDKDKDYYLKQLAVIKQINKLTDIYNDINSVAISYLYPYSGSALKSFSSVIKVYDDILNSNNIFKQLLGDVTISGNNIKISNHTELGVMFEKTVINTIKMYRDMFPHLQEKVIYAINSVIANLNLNKTYITIDKIVYSFRNYVINGNRILFNKNVNDERNRLLRGTETEESLGKRILRLRKLKELADNNYINLIKVELATNKSDIDYVSYIGSKSIKFDEGVIKNDIINMINSENEEIRKLAEDLLIYDYVCSLNGTINSLSRYYPYEYKKKIGLVNNLTSIKLYGENALEIEVTEFTRQFAQNNSELLTYIDNDSIKVLKTFGDKNKTPLEFTTDIESAKYINLSGVDNYIYEAVDEYENGIVKYRAVEKLGYKAIKEYTFNHPVESILKDVERLEFKSKKLTGVDKKGEAKQIVIDFNQGSNIDNSTGKDVKIINIEYTRNDILKQSLDKYIPDNKATHKEVLFNISKNSKLKYHREFSKFASSILNKLNVNVEIIQSNKNRTSILEDKMLVEIDNTSLAKFVNDTDLSYERTILHEISHVLLSKVVKTMYDNQNNLVKDYDKNLTKEQIEALQKLNELREHVIKQFDNDPEIKKQIENVLNYYSNRKLDSYKELTYYGLANTNEFIAEVLSNPKFQEILNNIEAPDGYNKNKSLLEHLLDIFKILLEELGKTFGIDIKENSILSASLYEINNLLNSTYNNNSDVSNKIPRREEIASGVTNKIQVNLDNTTVGKISTKEKPLNINVSGSENGYAIYTEHNGKSYSIIRDANKSFKHINNIAKANLQFLNNVHLELLSALEAVKVLPENEYANILHNLSHVQHFLLFNLIKKITNKNFKDKEEYDKWYKSLSEVEKDDLFNRINDIIKLDKSLYYPTGSRYDNRKGFFINDSKIKYIIDELTDEVIRRKGKLSLRWISKDAKGGNAIVNNLSRSSKDEDNLSILFANNNSKVLKNTETKIVKKDPVKEIKGDTQLKIKEFIFKSNEENKEKPQVKQTKKEEGYIYADENDDREYTFEEIFGGESEKEFTETFGSNDTDVVQSTNNKPNVENVDTNLNNTGSGVNNNTTLQEAFRLSNILEFRDDYKSFRYTSEQVTALNSIAEFILRSGGGELNNRNSAFLLRGYAGTGKTTIIENIIKYYKFHYNGSYYCTAPTNKAVRVLNNKLVSKGINKESIMTIHSMLFGGIDETTGEIILGGKNLKDALIIVDEASMVDKNLLDSLLNDCERCKIIFIGDDFQLEPVGANPKLFTWENSDYNFRAKNKSSLTQVIRQAEGSTILGIATAMRTKKEPIVANQAFAGLEDYKLLDRNILIESFKNSVINNEDSVMIISTNKDKITYNHLARAARYKGDVKNVINNNEKLISISNSSRANGESFIIENADNYNIEDFSINYIVGDKTRRLTGKLLINKVNSLDIIFLLPDIDIPSVYNSSCYFSDAGEGLYFRERFNLEIRDNENTQKLPSNVVIATYGYAITCHKSQGSQWEKVYINPSFMSSSFNAGKWYYTAVTRASKELYISKLSPSIKVEDVNNISKILNENTADDYPVINETIMDNSDGETKVKRIFSSYGVIDSDNNIISNIYATSKVNNLVNNFAIEREGEMVSYIDGNKLIIDKEIANKLDDYPTMTDNYVFDEFPVIEVDEELESNVKAVVVNPLRYQIGLLKKRVNSKLFGEKVEFALDTMSEISSDINVITNSDYSLNVIKQVAEKQLSFVNKIISKEKVNDLELLTSLNIINIWRYNNLRDLLTEEQLQNENNSFNKLVNEIASNAEVLKNKLTSLAIDYIVKVNNEKAKDKNEIISKDDLKELKDIGFVEEFTLDLSRNNNKAIQMIDNDIKNAARAYAPELLKIKNELGKRLNKIKDKLGKGDDKFDIFLQKDDKGNYVGLVHRYSYKYWNKINNITSRYVRMKDEAQFNTEENKKEAVKQANKDYFSSMAKLHINIDIRFKYVPNFKTDKFKNAYEYRQYLIEELGSEDLVNYAMEQAEERYERYIHDKQMAVQDIMDDDSIIDKDKAIKDWESDHSPIEYLNKLDEGGYSKYGYKYITSLPRTKIDGKDTGFYDKNFNKILKDKDLLDFYNYYVSTLNTLKGYLPSTETEDLPGNFLPNIQNSIVKQFLNLNFKEGLKYLTDEMIKGLAPEEAHLIAKTDKTNLERDSNGNIIRKVPIKYLKPVENRSFDLPVLLEMFAGMALNFKFKSLVEDKVLLIRHVISEAKIMAEAGKSKLLLDKFGNVVKIKDNSASIKKALDYAIEANLYGVKRANEDKGSKTNLYSLNPYKQYKLSKKAKLIENERDRIEIMVENGEITEKDASEKLLALEEEYRKLGGRNLIWSKIGDKILAYSQLKGMAYNVTAGLANVGFGLLSNINHAYGKVDYDQKSIIKAFGIMLKSIAKTNTKVLNLVSKLNILFEVTEVEYGKENSKVRMLKGLSPYEIQRRTEYFVQAMSMVAKMLYKKVNINGKTYSLWECYDDRGEWDTKKVGEQPEEWKSILESGVENEFTRFRNSVIQMNKLLHGNYDPTSPIKAKKYLLGRMLFQFRSWIPEGFAQRFISERYDKQLGRVVKGRWRTYADLGIGKSFKAFYKISIGKGSDLKLSDVDLENMRKNVGEIHLAIILYGISLMLSAMIDDDDRDLEDHAAILLLNVLWRVEGDIYFYFNPQTFENITRNMIPIMTIYTDFANAISATIKYQTDEDYRARVDKGRADRPIVKWAKALPGVRQIPKTQYMVNNVINR